jgi:tRNA dimethylallyltransferase
LELTNSFLIAIVGPTGSGKSALALAVAEFLGGEIVNFDSVQVYRGLDIGSAKTQVTERNGVPHHMLDIISPAEELTAGGYAMLARSILKDISSRRKVPVLAGGTGFYLRSLLAGLSPAPVRNPDLRVRLDALAARRPAALHRFLRRADQPAAQRIHPNDHQKLTRAIELSTQSVPAPREPLTGYNLLKIGLDPPRSELYDRINRRVLRMFEGGLLEETRALLDAGVPAASKALQTLGYKQAVAVLENRMSCAEAIVEVQTRTRQYAKRQMTWFRREPSVNWLSGFGSEPSIQQTALALISEHQLRA